MAIVDLYLYRMKLVLPSQRSLFHENLGRPEIFRRILEERPSAELRRGTYWHIGNLAFVDDYGGYFAAGRTTQSILEKYDASTGNFLEETLETSPYTHVLFDCQIGYLAIAKKTRLSPTVDGIARKLGRVLEGSRVARQNEMDVSLDAISDPHDFIESVRSAYSIKRFEVTFSRSNPFDADEFFQKPMEKYLDAANGQKGKTEVSGKDLDPETLISVTKSVAATGNDAKAVLRSREDMRYSTKKLRGNPAHFAVAEEEFSPQSGLAESRHLYSTVRGDEDVLDDYRDSEQR